MISLLISGNNEAGIGIRLLAHPAKKNIVNITENFFILMPRAGVEPARGCPRGILSPLRLPIPPPGPESDLKIPYKEKHMN